MNTIPKCPQCAARLQIEDVRGAAPKFRYLCQRVFGGCGWTGKWRVSK